MRLVPFATAVAAAAGLCAVDGCAHLSNGSVPGPGPSPTASASASPSQAPCQTTAAAGAQLVVISPLITPVVDPVYGTIAGYGPVTNGNASNVASRIVVSASTSVQFFNNDVSNSQLRYSAAGIPNVNAFPSPTYTFPPSATAPIGMQISATSPWSTGLLGGQCYSQTFTLAAPGTYFFGDYTYFGLANMRDVIVASPSP